MRHQFHGAAIAHCGICRRAKPAQQIGASGVKKRILFKVICQRINEGELAQHGRSDVLQIHELCQNPYSFYNKRFRASGVCASVT
ncbi:MAG: hypothetical protein ACJ8C4_09265 [Gemmataceae bacterium]